MKKNEFSSLERKFDEYFENGWRIVRKNKDEVVVNKKKENFKVKILHVKDYYLVGPSSIEYSVCHNDSGIYTEFEYGNIEEKDVAGKIIEDINSLNFKEKKFFYKKYMGK